LRSNGEVRRSGFPRIDAAERVGRLRVQTAPYGMSPSHSHVRFGIPSDISQGQNCDLFVEDAQTRDLLMAGTIVASRMRQWITDKPLRYRRGSLLPWAKRVPGSVAAEFAANWVWPPLFILL